MATMQTSTQRGAGGAATVRPAATEAVFLTLTVGGQLCGVPVLAVRDVLGPQAITRIPLAPPEVAGSLNLRGRIVTAIDLRRRLDLPPREDSKRLMSIVVERDGELYSLLADEVGEVLPLPTADRAPNPPTIDPRWREVSEGVHRVGDRLVVLLNVEALLTIG